MLKPPAVRPPATVGIAAPASPVRKEFLDRGVSELTRLGFRVRLGSRLYAKGRYTAGSVLDRLQDLVELWDDPEVAAVFCARGGYGSMHLLSELDPDRFRENPKVFLGSSDVTALLGFLGARAELVTFHGPMVAQQMARGAYDAETLLALIGTPEPAGALRAPGTEILHEGVAEGRLWGGCLSMLVSLVGTSCLPSFSDGILFLEDTQVKPYQIDRMLTQLRLAGLLGRVRGLVFGQLPNCAQHPEQGYTITEMLREWTSGLGIPVLFGFPSGHTTTNTMTLPLGISARLDENGLSLLEAAVR